MKSVSISGSPRANVGKKDATALRNAQQVPCVLYGGKEQIHFAVLSSDFRNLIYTPDVNVVDLEIAGKKYNAILQEAQFHKIYDQLLHVDFLEITPGKPVTMNIPVKTTGTSPGVRAGGKLVKKLKTLKAKGLVEKMPDTINIAIDEMQIGQSIRVEDIIIDGLTFLNASNITVVGVETTRVAAAEEAKAAAPGAKAAAPAAKAAAPAAGAKAAPAAKPAAKK
ncbi:MAG: 50S ribosomal protein L25/general stress protein Ctc [Bacteroidota bacterium]|nr:50S ribosomal protein L25/general stress protein Ctc [Bacteroidia bacterium]MDP1746594.1 50S ribosomal protein L25/general stress protein Ctc [Bacteroidota bacterium]